MITAFIPDASLLNFDSFGLIFVNFVHFKALVSDYFGFSLQLFFFHFYFISSLSDLEFSSYLLSLALISYFFPLASNSES